MSIAARPFVRTSAFLVLMFAAAAATAAELAVTSTADSGPGSLRQALADASAGDTIVFDLPLPAVITLSSGSLRVSRDLTISGPGASQLTVRRDAAAAPAIIFSVAQNVAATFVGMTITGARFPTWPGGGIHNDGGRITVVASVIAGNEAVAGGGIYSERGTVTLIDSTVRHNHSHDSFGGGGIFLWDARLTLIRSTIYGNTGVAPTALALHAEHNGARAQIVSSTIDGSIGNRQYLQGGPGPGTDMSIEGSTLTSGEPVALVRDLFPGFLHLTARNSVFRSAAGQPIFTGVTGFASLGHNLFSTAPDALGANDFVGDPRLGALVDNGGTAFTRALLAGSAAIDAGSCTDAAGAAVTADQRGVPRPLGGACDIGAFEAASAAEQQLAALAALAVQLDAPLSSRASQEGLDAVGASLGTLHTALATLQTTIASKAEDASVQQLQALVASLPALDLGAIDTKLTNVATDVAALSSQASIDALTRYAIERALAAGEKVVSYILPRSAGGQLEQVRELVDASIAGMQSTGADVRVARKWFLKGEAAYALHRFSAAYDAYADAYAHLLRKEGR